jgi:arylsulfatase/arylsulfatase A
MHFAVRTQKYKLVSPHDDPHHILYQPTDQELWRTLENLELYDMENDPSERINLAGKHPDIVDDLLESYEDWYDEVTQERDAKGIQRIYLGTEVQPEVILSRFDWGGPRVIQSTYLRSRDNQLGYWRVKTESGMYEISLDLPEMNADGVAHIKYRDVHLTLPVQKDQEKLVFHNVELPGGTGVRKQSFF